MQCIYNTGTKRAIAKKFEKANERQRHSSWHDLLRWLQLVLDSHVNVTSDPSWHMPIAVLSIISNATYQHIKNRHLLMANQPYQKPIHMLFLFHHIKSRHKLSHFHDISNTDTC